MEIEITKPTKKVDWTQLAGEAGVTLGGIRTKGDSLFFMDNTQSDIDKIKTALETHIPEPKQPQGFNSTQLAQIRQVVQEELAK